MNLSPMKRKLRAVPRRLREARMFAKAMRSPRHPIVTHIIPTRRCNLACAYCNEYDNFSQPVPTEEMLRRVDRLAALGTTIITISGGEPLLHPQLDCIISRIHEHGIIPTLIINGYLLNPERIRRLNRTGLHQLQISIDNLAPDDISKVGGRGRYTGRQRTRDTRLRPLVNIDHYCNSPRDTLAPLKCSILNLCAAVARGAEISGRCIAR
jgi:uncharacterized Fe-S cluster-containing radical SAM superfamily protein